MATLAIEFSDVGFQAAIGGEAEPRFLAFTDKNGAPDWPGFAYHDGQKVVFGRAAEDMWFVQPRRVIHTFWDRLAHEPSTLNVPVKLPSFSELAFHFLREFTREVASTTGSVEKIVFAIPGTYLKDATTEDEKIGLLLGMASELKLPLVGIVDMAAAGLCDSRVRGLNPALPVVVIDVGLQGTDLTLFVSEERLVRKSFQHMHNSGYAQLLKLLTTSMGNRFLRHSAFDILEDGRIEQIFYRQTRDFALTGAADYRFQINTAKRNYEMLAKSEQLVADAQGFVATVVQGVQSFVRSAGVEGEGCSLTMTHRAARIPGLEAKLRATGFRRIIALPEGAAACGAAIIAAKRLPVLAEIADVPVESSVLVSDVHRSVGSGWQTKLLKGKSGGDGPVPTHAILDGIGWPIGSKGRFVIGAGGKGNDLPLPEPFNASDDHTLPLLSEGGRLWFVDSHVAPSAADESDQGQRVPVEPGDRLAIRAGSASAEILFAHCPGANGHSA